jgi:hypothetical protein
MKFASENALTQELVLAAIAVKRTAYRHIALLGDGGKRTGQEIHKCELCKSYNVTPAPVTHRRDCPVPRLSAVLKQIRESEPKEEATQE